MENFVSEIFLSNEIIIFLFLQTILYLLFSIALFKTVQIIRFWDFSKSSSYQYSLEKGSYLTILIIVFSLCVKIFLFFYFIFSVDKLSFLIVGAMCATGVFSTSIYGEFNLALKVFTLFFAGFWLILNHFDLITKDYKYTKIKFILFLPIFILFSFEIVLDYLFLLNIPINSSVSCCSVVFGLDSLNSGIAFNLDIYQLISLFYLIYFLTLVTNFLNRSFLSVIANLLFLYVSYYSVIYFFSTYIYELPTHQCPFCMMQKEYNFVGYFVWSFLILGTFFSLCNFVLLKITKIEHNKLLIYSNIFNSLFVLLVTFYVARYYFVNGVFL